MSVMIPGNSFSHFSQKKQHKCYGFCHSAVAPLEQLHGIHVGKQCPRQQWSQFKNGQSLIVFKIWQGENIVEGNSFALHKYYAWQNYYLYF